MDNEDSVNYRLGKGFIVDDIEEEDCITYYPVMNGNEIDSMNELDISSNNTYSTLSYNDNEKNNVSLYSFPVLGDGTDYRILDVDCEEQSGEYCYAYAGSAVIRYLRGGTTAPTAATLKTRKNNGSWSTTRSFIKDQMDTYDLDGVSTGVYSYSNIQSQIDDSKPMYSEWWSDDGVGHALSGN